MQSLYSYISKPLIDGHLHAFDHEGCLKCPPMTPYAVGFADIVLRKPNQYKDMSKLYKTYIPKCPWVKYWLATGLDINSIKKVYEENREYIRGFGELKLYDMYKGKEIDMKDIRFAKQVCKFSEEVGRLPVYIHYNLVNDGDVKKFKKLLEQYSTVPVVLCHCGMSEESHMFAWEGVLKLMREHGNLWVDVSWEASKWLFKNPFLLTQLIRERVIWGSDDSPARHRVDDDPNRDVNWTDEEIKEGTELLKFITQNANIEKLFNERF